MNSEAPTALHSLPTPIAPSAEQPLRSTRRAMTDLDSDASSGEDGPQRTRLRAAGVSLRSWSAKLGPSSLLIALASFAYMIFRTLWPLPVGLADNGDGPRYICGMNLEPLVEGVQRYSHYAIFDWVTASEPAINCTAYPSSEVWILRAAQWFTHQMGGAEGALDLRWIILANAILIAALIGLFAFAIRRAIGYRIALSIMMLLVLSDPTFANYAGSIFGEFPGLVGVGVMSIGALYVGTAGAKQWLGLVLFAAGSALALTSKTQGVTLIIPIAIFLLCTTMRRRSGKPTAPWWKPRRLALVVLGKIVPLAVVAGLIIPPMWVLDNNPTQFQAINPWELISVGILGNSPDPTKDLVEMGFPAELDKYAGDNVWVEDSILNSPDWDANKDNMTYWTAAKFFLAHPDRAIVIANNAGNDYFATRPTYLGTYGEDTGKERGTYDYSLISEIGSQLQGIGITPLVLFWGVVVFCSIRIIRRSEPGTFRRAFASAAILLVAVSMTQFVTASFGEAIENTKHMVYGILAGAIAPVFALAGWLERRPSQMTTIV